jgi:flagellar FliL protein
MNCESVDPVDAGPDFADGSPGRRSQGRRGAEGQLYQPEPPFGGNYRLDGTAKLKVFKADIALRVTGTEAAALVKANDPLIRNQLVALFTQQTNEAMSTVEGKEKLRQEALKQTQQVMNDETGKPVVEDLLFNNLIIQ